MRVSSRANKGQDSRIKYEDQQAEVAAIPRPAKRSRAQQIAIPAIPLPALPVNDNIDNVNPLEIDQSMVYIGRPIFICQMTIFHENILVLLKTMRNYQHL